jgi:outer membrane protein OmpA-like peptidoglycan-associated protein
MPDQIRLTVEPKDNVDSAEAESLQIRITYQIPGKTDDGEPTTHPGSDILRLDRHARAEATLQPIALDQTINAILENRQGLEIADLGTIDGAPASEGETVKLVIPSATLKQALARLEPDQQPVLARSGRFVRLGQPEQRFDQYTLSVDLVDTPAKQDALKALLGQSPEGALGTSSSQSPLDATTAKQLGVLSLTAADLKFDGSFQINRYFDPKTEAPGWAWLLNGPELIIGYREDPTLRLPQRDLRILLPWQEKGAEDSGASKPGQSENDKHPPLNVNEESLLNEPDLFSDDPGSYCKPFSNPARILGERRFHTVFRVEQPEIESTANTKPDYKGLLHPKDASQPVMIRSAMVANNETSNSAFGSGIPVLRNLGSSLNRFLPRDNTPLMPPVKAIDFLPLPQIPWLNRRQPVGPNNPIDWDGDSTQYQALSVAGGHILEWRVQWRSNGYSLGDVAHTLTLAPRQTRRIVKLDWRHHEQSIRSERTEFGEEVSQTTLRERDYNDAVRSNLNEWSKGGSKSQTTGGGGGIGFAAGPVVIGGGAAHGRASSRSWQKGGRSVAAAEEQSLRDAVRQFGDSLRQFESTVVNEVSQDESIEGVSEVVRNPNYCHSLTVIYHEILRHMRVDTVLTGVRECLFVPFSIRPFTQNRIARWRDVFERYLQKRELRWALKYAEAVANNWEGVDTPPDGERTAQAVRSLSGSIYIKLGIERPRYEVVSDEIDDLLKEEGAVGEKVTTRVWQAYAGILPIPVGQIVARIRDYSASQRDAYFQREIAPSMARRWIDRLKLETDSGELQGTDFTLVGEYQFNRTVRVDFNVPTDSLSDTTRAALTRLTLSASEHLPKGSVANVTSATVEFHTDHYNRRVRASTGTQDLISPPAWDDEDTTRPAPTESATLTFNPSNWEKQNPRREAEKANENILDHINDNLHYYHKVLWWTMDRDELYMLLDGFAISSSDRRSIASVVEREPIAILGNSLVFRVAAGAFLGVNGHESYEEALNYYKGEGAPSTPMRVSLPTDGLYAQAIMDQCEACEEHQGSTDWVLNDEDPALAEFPSTFFDSRRTQPQNMTPTNMPDSIINLQNAPAAPAPQGFGNILGTLGSNSAFRDMAGLEGTQKNAMGALNSAAGLAGQFGGYALQARLAELQSERDAGKNFDKKRAAIDRAVKKGSMPKADGEKALQAQAKAMGRRSPSGLSTNLKDLVERFGGERDVSVTETTPDGRVTTSVKAAQSRSDQGSGTMADELEGAVAGPDGAAASRHSFPIAQSDPLDEEAIFNHSFFATPSKDTIESFFPIMEPVEDRISDAERQRSMTRPFFFTVGGLNTDRLLSSAENPDLVQLLSYIVYDFPVASSVITRDDLKPLRNLLERRAAALKERNQILEIQILGTADSTGPADENARLQKERAQAVAEGLQSIGYRISYIGPSDSRLFNDNNEYQRALNRSVTVRETLTATNGIQVRRKDDDIDDLKTRIREILTDESNDGDKDANIALTIMNLYDSGGNLEVLLANKVREYYRTYAVDLARRYDNPLYRPEIFFTDGRYYLEHNLQYAPSVATLNDLDAAARDVINLLKVLAEATYDGINVHMKFGGGGNNPDSDMDAWDRMNAAIKTLVDRNGTIYGDAFDMYKGKLESPFQ